MDYANSKIYCLRNSINDEIYVGSTTQRLSKRLSYHKKAAPKGTSRVYQEMASVGVQNFYIELLENYPCNSKDELHKREGEYIRQMATLNKNIAGRNKEEFKKRVS